jgi:hypothetical protein
MPSSGRFRSAEGSRPAIRPTRPHPDADRATKRMPYHQLRALVLSSIESTEVEDDPTNEFEAQPTVCVRVARVSTIDQLIASLPKHYG